MIDEEKDVTSLQTAQTHVKSGEIATENMNQPKIRVADQTFYLTRFKLAGCDSIHGNSVLEG